MSSEKQAKTVCCEICGEEVSRDEMETAEVCVECAHYWDGDDE